MENRWSRDLVREPVVEGLFYPDEPKSLLDGIRKNLQNARTVAGKVRGIIVPNASFQFISSYSAEVFKRASTGDYQRVVILAPWRGETRDAFLLPESTLFRTPLGISRVDATAMEILFSSSTTADISEVIHLQEHGIEVQLPWIQAAFPEAEIVPILSNATGIVGVKALASALKALELESPRPTLYVASINLTPALPSDLAASQSGELINYLLEGRWEEMLAARRRGELASPGVAAAAALCILLHRQQRLEILLRGNSREYDKNDSSVVEYASMSYEEALSSGGQA
jgi:AmmeMemoRadiSam system protein B